MLDYGRCMHLFASPYLHAQLHTIDELGSTFPFHLDEVGYMHRIDGFCSIFFSSFIFLIKIFNHSYPL